jgi:rod shape-determining protein MreD
MSRRESAMPVTLTTFIALVLMTIPLPFWLAIVKPAFLVLIIMYWSTMAPHVAGITLAFAAGLALDVMQGSLIGQHALALALLSYLAIRFHLQLRAKPIFEQSVFALAALVLYETLLWLIDGWSGQGASNPWRWLYTLTSAMCWPLVVGVMGRFHTPH